MIHSMIITGLQTIHGGQYYTDYIDTWYLNLLCIVPHLYFCMSKTHWALCRQELQSKVFYIYFQTRSFGKTSLKNYLPVWYLVWSLTEVLNLRRIFSWGLVIISLEKENSVCQWLTDCVNWIILIMNLLTT